MQITCHTHKLKMILTDYIYHQNKKSKPREMDLPFLKKRYQDFWGNDIYGLITKHGIEIIYKFVRNITIFKVLFAQVDKSLILRQFDFSPSRKLSDWKVALLACCRLVAHKIILYKCLVDTIDGGMRHFYNNFHFRRVPEILITGCPGSDQDNSLKTKDMLSRNSLIHGQ